MNIKNDVINGRIIKGVGGLYSVKTEYGLYKGRPRGIFRKENIKPTIGDFVEISVLSEADMECSIDKILPRKNILVRPAISNIDQVIIVFAVKSPDPNLDLLDKFILVSEHNDLEIVICLNKSDLISENEKIEIKNIYEKIGYKVLFVSTFENNGISEIKEILKNKVSVFAGPSGVGKSSIINLLFPEAQMQTGGLSEKIQRGKHTTRHVELLEIYENTFLADSPGFTSLSIDDIDKEDLQYLFREFSEYLGECKYNNCIHIKENGCKIKENVPENISEIRYNRYVSLYNEKADRDAFLMKK